MNEFGGNDGVSFAWLVLWLQGIGNYLRNCWGLTRGTKIQKNTSESFIQKVLFRNRFHMSEKSSEESRCIFLNSFSVLLLNLVPRPVKKWPDCSWSITILISSLREYPLFKHQLCHLFNKGQTLLVKENPWCLNNPPKPSFFTRKTQEKKPSTGFQHGCMWGLLNRDFSI
jgi:hypothetical protein